MAKSNKIGLGKPVDVVLVLEVARSVTESRGYAWEPTGTGTAKAYQDGNRGAGSSSMDLVVGIEVRDDSLVLTQESSGGMSAAIGLGPFGASATGSEFKKVGKAIGEALGKAQLTV